MLDNSSRPLLAEGPANVNVTAARISIPVRFDSWGPNQPIVLQAALWYAGQGIAVFPLGPAKRPLARCAACRPVGACPGRDECRCGVDTCHGFYAATLDRAVITRWWGRHPDWQIGLRTGQVSDLVALDVDLDKGGLDSLIALQQAGLAIRDTAAQLSGSGLSFHLLYRHPGGTVQNSAGRLGNGLDVRGDGGYVVGAPSRHPDTGARYELLGELTQLPVWRPPSRSEHARLFATAPKPKQQRNRSLASGGTGRLTRTRVQALVDLVGSAQPGRRRELLFWAGCRLGECSGTQAARLAVAQLLLEAAASAGMTEHKAFDTLRGALQQGGV